MDERTDAEVVAASLADAVVFGVLFDRHAGAVHRFLVRRLGPDDARGVVGEVFRIAFERRATFDRCRASARPWLYSIAGNLVALRRRSESRQLRAVAWLAARRAERGDIADTVSAAVDAARSWPRVVEAVAALPAPERDALLLHAWEGLSYDEVAAALGIPPGTVRSRIHRARRRLRELVGPNGEQLGGRSSRPAADGR